jgi:hypothetical protein
MKETEEKAVEAKLRQIKISKIAATATLRAAAKIRIVECERQLEGHVKLRHKTAKKAQNLRIKKKRKKKQMLRSPLYSFCFLLYKLRHKTRKKTHILRSPLHSEFL